jgi:hypothetical protein
MIRWKPAVLLAILLAMPVAVGPTALAATSRTIDDTFPGALTAYQAGGIKGAGGDATSGRVIPVLPPAAYMDAIPDSLAWVVRKTPLFDDFDMTLDFMLVGRLGAPEKVAFLINAKDPTYPTTCCWGDTGQIHARSGLWLVYDLSAGYVWSLYEERDYATAATPLVSVTRFLTFSAHHALRIVTHGDFVDVYADGTPVLGALTSPMPPGQFGIESYRVDLFLYSARFQIDCSDPTLPDADGDGTADSCDNCPDDANPAQEDSDIDQMGDVCDPCPLDHDNDADLDGVCGNVDNCVAIANTDQADVDQNGQGDLCDLNDGLLMLSFIDKQQVTWQTDSTFDSYNLYAGNLDVLKSTGVYTQPAGSNSVAQRWCNSSQSLINWSTIPPVGQAIFFLASGNRNLVESSLGNNSSGQPRPNQNPCPHKHGRININGDAGFTAANGVVGGSGTAADPYVIGGWPVDPSGGNSGITIQNTTRSFIIRNVTIDSPTSYGIYLANNTGSARVEGSRLTGLASAGIFTGFQQNLTIDGNVISTPGTGISIQSSEPLTISGNQISGGQRGIVLAYVVVSSIHGNQLLNNAVQAIDDAAANHWNAAWPEGGNYWTDYLGTDQCSGPQQNDCAAGPDGFGDQPYLIDADTIDSYPLMIKPGSGPDTTPPLLSITGPPDGASFTASTLTVTGTASDAGSGLRAVALRLNGGPWTVASGLSAWSQTVTLAPGPNWIEARAYDHAGNISNPASRNVTWVVPPLAVTVATSRSTYAPGEGVDLTVTVRNQSASPVTLHFPTGCQALFKVETISGASLYDVLLHASCPPDASELTLSPGQSRAYPFFWDQRNDAGTFVPAPADYVIRGSFDTPDTVPTGLATLSVVTPRLDIVVRTDKTLYATDEQATVTMIYTNRTSQPVTLNFPTTCHLFFRVETLSGSLVYDERYHDGCFDALTSLTLQPGQSSTGTALWPIRNDSGQPVATPAEYIIIGFSDSYEAVPEGRTRVQAR